MKKKITTGLCIISFISFIGVCNYTYAAQHDVLAEADVAKVENINCNKAYKNEVCIKINDKNQSGRRHE